MSHAYQKAEQEHHRRKQPLPSRLCPLPAVGAHGLGSVLRLDVTGLRFEDPIGGFQVVGSCGRRGLRTQETPGADGCGDVDLLPIEGLVMLVGQQMIKRQGRMDDLANLCLFLCSDDASFVTGQTILVDGGFTKKPY